MKWSADEIEKYENARTYFDTVIIPVYHLQLEGLRVETFRKVHRLENVCTYIENQVKGRAVLLPVWYQYTPGPDLQTVKSDILNQTTFSHVLFVTAQKEISNALRWEDVHVFDISDHDPSEKEQEPSLIEIGNRGYECLIKLWKK